ncbi:MAG: DNA translocase FtsK [Bacteroidales bacterium]|nr:DNA translocase FtsK [Bacteroidales bacterium]
MCNMLGPLGTGAVILVALLLWSVLLSRKVAFWFDDVIYLTSHRPEREPVEDGSPSDGDDFEDDTVNEFAGADGLEEISGLTGDVSEEKVEPVEAVEPEPGPQVIVVPEEPDEGSNGIIPAEKVELIVDESENDFLSNLSEDERARIYDPRLDLPKYELPSTSLLEDYRDRWYEVSRDELEMNKQRIVNALANYKIGVTGITAKVGPTVTLYKIRLAEGVKIAQVRRLEEDIAISLGAKGVRVVTLLDSVGIEVPNEKASTVALKAVLNSPQFKEAEKKMSIPLALGITVTSEPYFIDLAKMPHLLVAGATGMGKSVGLNCILTSMLFTKHPAELKLVLVDPKKVELSLYNKIDHHFLAKLPDGDEAIITETKKVIYTLKSLCIEMDDRYELLKEADVRQIKDYNEKFLSRKLNPLKGHKFMPYIVVVIDEFADLLVTAGREIEEPIARLAQKARAVGIHLVIATQRPTTDIITGTIKANFNARIAFRVNTMIDSRTIIDAPGANRLIGRGDMLVMAPGEDLVRVQCALVDTPEIIRINKFISDQRGYSGPFLLPEYVDENDEGDGAGDVDLLKRDKLFDEAAKIVVQYQQGSTSLLQRKLNLGYNRAGRIIDQLEAAGIVGPFEGSKARAVLITDFDTLDRKLESLDHQTIV